MSPEFDQILDRLAKALESLLGTPPEGRRFAAGTPSAMDDKVSAKVSVNIGFLDEILSGSSRAVEPLQPLIDVIEDKENIRVVVLLPGVKKEGVLVTRLPGAIRVEVTKGDSVYAKVMPCVSDPTEISVVSAKENNSVVELVFAKKETGLR